MAINAYGSKHQKKKFDMKFSQSFIALLLVKIKKKSLYRGWRLSKSRDFQNVKTQSVQIAQQYGYKWLKTAKKQFST
jgi:hypothetical protein